MIINYEMSPSLTDHCFYKTIELLKFSAVGLFIVLTNYCINSCLFRIVMTVINRNFNRTFSSCKLKTKFSLNAKCIQGQSSLRRKWPNVNCSHSKHGNICFQKYQVSVETQKRFWILKMSLLRTCLRKVLHPLSGHFRLVLWFLWKNETFELLKDFLSAEISVLLLEHYQKKNS